ncbi:MAG: hypothetical protein ACFE8J_19025 [Candidatus Heimdallarchaeota archaeon]
MITPFLLSLMYISFFILLFTSLYLFYRMIKTKLYNLIGLFIFFILYPLQTILSSYIPNILYILTVNLSFIFLTIFVKQTFYNETKSLFPYVISSFIILKVLDFILRIEFQFQSLQLIPVDPIEAYFYFIFIISINLQVIIPSLWFTYASLFNYNLIRRKYVEPWLKKRYLVISLSSLIFTIDGIMSFLILINNIFIFTFLIYFSVITVTLFSIGNLIGWFMPNRIKEFYNRNFEPSQEEILSEKELMEKIRSQLSGSVGNGHN